MADPFSIVGTVVSLVVTGAHVSRLIYNFTNDVIDAPASLLAASNELTALCRIFQRLEQSLKEDFDSTPPFPSEMAKDLREVLNSCMTVLGRLERVITKFTTYKKGGLSDVKNRVKWVLADKDIAKIRKSLESHKDTLNITLMLTLNWNTSQINRDTKEILRLVDRLLEQARSQTTDPDRVVIDAPNTSLDGNRGSPPGLMADEIAPTQNTALPATVDDALIQRGNSDSQKLGEVLHIMSEATAKQSVPEPPLKSRTNSSAQNDAVETGSINAQQHPSDDKPATTPLHANEAVHIVQNVSKLTVIDNGQTSTENTAAIEKQSLHDNDHEKYDSIDETSEAVRIAMETGNLEMVLLLLDFVEKVDAKNVNYAAALEIAATNGQEDVLRSLLERGADPNSPGTSFPTPLIAAISHGKDEICRILLEAGAKPSGNVIYLIARRGGSVDLVRTLLDVGADIEARGGWSDTPLIEAVRNGNLELVALLLDRGADRNTTDYGGLTVLENAIQIQDTSKVQDMMELLLRNDSDPNIGSPLCLAAKNETDTALRILLAAGAKVDLQNPVFMAAKFGRVDNLKLLLDKGANINAKGGHHQPPLSEAINDYQVETVKTLIERGADINLKGLFDYTPLVNAIRLQDAEMRHKMMQLLINGGADLDTGALVAAATVGSIGAIKMLLDAGADASIENAVFFAAKHDHIEIIKLLLDAGGDINARGDYGEAPITVAVTHGRVEIVKFLIERGADVNVKSLFGDNLMQSAVQLQDIETMRQIIEILLGAGLGCNYDAALVTAAKAGSADAVKILLDAGADIEVKDGLGDTALIWAIQQAKLDTVTTLLARGANISTTGHQGKSPITLALEGNSQDIVRAFLAHGIDSHGPGLLQTAAKSGNLEAVKSLLDSGADVNTVDQENGSALQAAAAGGHEDIIRLLFERGFDTKAPGCSIGAALNAALKAKQNHVAKILLQKQKAR